MAEVNEYAIVQNSLHTLHFIQNTEVPGLVGFEQKDGKKTKNYQKKSLLLKEVHTKFKKKNLTLHK